MNIALWIVQILLAALFAGAGTAKLFQPHEKLAAHDNMAWTGDFTPSAVKGIAALEIAAAIGLIIPPLIDLAPLLAPLAATGLGVVMIGAAFVHNRRRETQSMVMNIALLALAAFVAWGRFGPESF